MRYIEINPVRSDMVKSPNGYRWSSYRANAQGRASEIVKPHPLYKVLSRSKNQRLDAYKALFKAHINKQDLDDIRASWQTATSLGNDYFKNKIESKLKCKVGQA